MEKTKSTAKDMKPIPVSSFETLQDFEKVSEDMVVSQPPQLNGNPRQVRVGFYVDTALLGSIRNYGFWNSMNQAEVILHILSRFFAENKVEERPEEVKRMEIRRGARGAIKKS